MQEAQLLGNVWNFGSSMYQNVTNSPRVDGKKLNRFLLCIVINIKDSDVDWNIFLLFSLFLWFCINSIFPVSRNIGGRKLRRLPAECIEGVINIFHTCLRIQSSDFYDKEENEWCYIADTLSLISFWLIPTTWLFLVSWNGTRFANVHWDIVRRKRNENKNSEKLETKGGQKCVKSWRKEGNKNLL